MTRVLLTGATGFVGGHLYPELVEAGHEVVCASRNPKRAARNHPDRTWIRLDVNAPDTLAAAFEKVDVVYYLIHAMAEGEGYRERELRAAKDVRRAAADAGVGRLIYLGGVEPEGEPSEHLESRLATGRALREGSVPCIELRAGMIIGVESESWRICRDLAVRLPFMILPSWLATRSEPIAIEDVVFALCAAATMPIDGSVALDLPGPEVLSAKEILFRIARLRGTAPLAVKVPLLTPKLSSYWLKLVTGADYSIARELVEGLKSDLLSGERTFWDHFPDHERTPFDRAAQNALDAEPSPPVQQRMLEGLARRLARSVPAD